MNFLGLIAQTDGAEVAAEALGFWERIQGGAADLQTWASASTPRLMMAAVLGSFGLWLLMPGRRELSSRVLGSVLCGVAAVCLLSLAPVAELSLGSAMFTVLAALTTVAAVATVTSRSPIYSAVWFAGTLLGVGGLFLINGAQFLGIATVAVYAGAIVVTLLFVLMLAQPEGHTHYDRISWGVGAQWMGCAAGALMTCLLVWALLDIPAENPTDVAANPVLAENHVANLGGQLFSTHLMGVELAAVLLFVALVGAVAMASTARHQTAIEGQVDNIVQQSRQSGTDLIGEVGHE